MAKKPHLIDDRRFWAGINTAMVMACVNTAKIAVRADSMPLFWACVVVALLNAACVGWAFHTHTQRA